MTIRNIGSRASSRSCEITNRADPTDSSDGAGTAVRARGCGYRARGGALGREVDRAAAVQAARAGSVGYSMVGMLLLVVTLVACAIPALRAARADPSTALRADQTKRKGGKGGGLCFRPSAICLSAYPP
jgi:hypothetical protein